MTPYYSKDGIVLYCGDNRDILLTLGRFDLCLTDPPYGINASNMVMGSGQSGKAKRDRIANADWDSQRPDMSFCDAVAALTCVWGGNYFTDHYPPTNHWLVWHKMNDGRSFSECEFAWTNFGKQSRHFAWGWHQAKETKVHKTQKPIPLMRWCLQLVPDAKTVCDPFAGSGTTLLAAKLEGRQCTGIEINEDYCRIAVERLRQGVLDFGGNE